MIMTRTALGYAVIDAPVERTLRGLYRVREATMERGLRGLYRVRPAAMERAARGAYILLPPATRSQRGAYEILPPMTRSPHGRYRVEDTTIEGYIVRVGYGAMPDHTAAPDGFSTTRPVVLSVTPPGAGTEDLYIVLRKRNAYGIESQNQQVRIITIDTSGNEVLGTLSAPTGVVIEPVVDEAFLVFATYPGYHTDANRGDTWRVYHKSRVKPDLGTVMSELRGTATDVLSAVFGTTPRVEPYKTFANLFYKHYALPYQMTGLVLAYIYTLNRIRTDA